MKTKKNMLLLTASLLILVSCKKNNESINEDKISSEKMSSSTPFSCEIKVDSATTGVRTESNGPANKLWLNGSVIRVKFIGGSALVRQRVRQYAESWETHANIDFSFVPDNEPADIKVAFNAGGGSWSYMGTGSRNQNVSMNFGWFNDQSPESDFRRTITHEFGHALGLSHEQSHPDANIPWNRVAVYDYYMGPPNNWTREKVNSNVLNVSPRRGLNFTPYDQTSVMHYPVQARFTTNNVAIAQNNTRISDNDALYMRTYYPGR